MQSLINSSNEVRVAAASTVKKVAEASKFSTEDLQQLVPPLLEGTQEKNSPVRLSAEQALVSALELRKSDATFQVQSLNLILHGNNFTTSVCYS